jgi:hypothetical protein
VSVTYLLFPLRNLISFFSDSAKITGHFESAKRRNDDNPNVRKGGNDVADIDHQRSRLLKHNIVQLNRFTDKRNVYSSIVKFNSIDNNSFNDINFDRPGHRLPGQSVDAGLHEAFSPRRR